MNVSLEQPCENQKDVALCRRRLFPGQSGLTLLELVAVVAVICVLVVLMTVSTKGIRDNTLRAKCAANLRQIGVGAVMFAQDNNGSLPVTADISLGLHPAPIGLINFLGGYLPDYRVFYCTDARNGQPGGVMTSRTYAFNAAGLGPSKFYYTGYWWLVCDSVQFRVPLPQKLAGSAKRILTICPDLTGGTIHNRSFNALFVDGHIEVKKNKRLLPNASLVSQQQLNPLEWRTDIVQE